jgi:hypothetical protein
MSPLERRRARVREIRKRVVAGALALFILVFSGITVQLAAGNDPALSKPTAKATTTSSTPATSTPTQSPSSNLAPVTTSQS